MIQHRVITPDATKESMPKNEKVDSLKNENGVQPLLWNVRQAAARLSVSPVTIRKLVRQQRLARVPNIRKLLIPDVSLQKFAATAE